MKPPNPIRFRSLRPSNHIRRKSYATITANNNNKNTNNNTNTTTQVNQILNQLKSLSPLIHHPLTTHTDTRRKRLGIWSDRKSRGHELISCIVSSFVNSQSSSYDQLVWDRHKHQKDGMIKIKYGNVARRTEDVLEIPSEWLSEQDLEIYEHPTHSPEDQTMRVVTNCDVQVLVIDEIRELQDLYIPLIRRLAHYHPHFIVVLNQISHDKIGPDQLDQIKHSISQCMTSMKPPELITINTHSAISSLQSFGTWERLSQDLDRKQLIDSGFYQLRTRVVDLLSSDQIRILTSINTGRLWISLIYEHILKHEESLIDLVSDLHILEQTYQHLKRDAQACLSIVDQFDERDLRRMDSLLSDRLSLWKVLVGSDRVAIEILIHEERDQTELEQLLAFRSGQLSKLSETIIHQTESFMTDSRRDPYLDEVTKNQIRQRLPKSTDTPLTGPILTRRERLIKGPIATLEARAQEILLSMSGVSLGIGVLVGSKIWGGTIWWDSLGIGGSIGMLAIWKTLRDWDRAKRAFRRDWCRSRDGLGSELQEQAKEIVGVKLMSGPELLVRGIKSRIERERDDRRGWVKVIDECKNRLDEVESSLTPDKPKRELSTDSK